MTEIYVPQKRERRTINKLKILLLFGFLAVIATVAAAGYLYMDYQEPIVPLENNDKIGVWCNISDCYWFDKNGIAIEKSPRPDGNLVIVVTDGSGELEKGKIVMEGGLWENFLPILTSWLVKDLGINIFLVDREKQELVAKAAEFDILLSLRFNPLINLEALKQTELRGKQFDLRVENKIYYK